MVRYFNLKEAAHILGIPVHKMYRMDEYLKPDFRIKGIKAKKRLYSSEILEQIIPKDQWPLAGPVKGRKTRKKEDKPRKVYKLRANTPPELRTLDAGIRAYWYIYKNGARARNITYELTIRQFIKLIAGPCRYCGEPPAPRSVGAYTVIVNGIDRKDSSKAYTQSNCVSSCSDCNRMKWTLGEDHFIAQAKKIASFNSPHPAQKIFR